MNIHKWIHRNWYWRSWEKVRRCCRGCKGSY